MGKFVLHLDASPYLTIAEGVPPIWQMSHNRLPLGIGQDALNAGHELWIVGGGHSRPVQVSQLYPSVRLGKVAALTSKSLAGSIHVCLYVGQMLGLKSLDSSFTVAWVLSACHWLENSDYYPSHWIKDLENVATNDLDIVITQSEIMKQQVLALTDLLGANHLKDRFLIAWSSPEKEHVFQKRKSSNTRSELRSKFGITPDQKVIVNAGGAWDWTDLRVFLEAFGQWCRTRNNPNLKFVQLGIRQTSNKDHELTHDYILSFLDSHKDLVSSGNLEVISDWDIATNLIDDYLCVADFGLNVNQNSLEGFQSVRQRFLDYLSAGVPVFNTLGDQSMYRPLSEACVFVTPGDLDSYLTAFDKISDVNFVVPSVISAREVLLENIDYSKVTEALIDQSTRQSNIATAASPQQRKPKLINSLLSDRQIHNLSLGMNFLLPRFIVVSVRFLLEKVHLIERLTK